MRGRFKTPEHNPCGRSREGNRLNEPRYPTLKGIMGAKKKEIKDLNVAGLGLASPSPQLAIRALEALPARPPGRIIQGDVQTAVKELVRALREDAKAI